MRQNRRHKAILHSAMRQNTITRIGRPRPLVWVVLGVLLTALLTGLWIGYSRLHALWAEQCAVTDIARQVSITTGANIKAGLILEHLGLKKGANLAEIDFAEKRREILERIPNIRALTIARHQPDRIEITVEEREPIARMNVKGNKTITGRAVDAEGVVFIRQAGTSLLPTVFEGQPFTGPGQRLSGRAKAALRMLEACRDKDLAELGILNVDTTYPDFLVATLGNYSRAKIAWEGMDAPTAETNKRMTEQLTALRDAVRQAGPYVKIWNATIQGRVFGDTKEPIL